MPSPAVLLVIALALLLLPTLAGIPTARHPELRGSLRGLWWLNQLYCRFLHRLEIEGPVTIPDRGPAILVANHTCGIDHMLLQAATDRVLGFLIAQEYYDHWLCHPIARRIGCIPVRRDGSDLAATRAALRALKDGRVVPVFPEGRIHPTSGREIREGRPGAAFLAIQSRVPVIPAYIRGTPPTNHVFTVLATPSIARIRFGPPVDLSDFRKADHDALAAATRRIMAAIETLQRQSLAEVESPTAVG